MKVKTHLKSGSLLSDAARLSCQSAQATASFVERANQQAVSLANSVSDAARSAWNTLTGWIS